MTNYDRMTQKELNQAILRLVQMGRAAAYRSPDGEIRITPPDSPFLTTANVISLDELTAEFTRKEN